MVQGIPDVGYRHEGDPEIAVPGLAQAMEEGSAKRGELLEILLGTTRHFFGDFLGGFASIEDPRFQPFVTYPLPCEMFTAILMFLFHLGARRQIRWYLNVPSAAEKFKILFDVKSVPHGDTLDYLFSKLNPDQVAEVVSGLTATLIRKKVLYRYRLLDTYFLVALDGTGVLSFDQRHCDHCMRTKSGGKEYFYHPVLEAKLVTPNGFAFSLMTEFIENRDVDQNQSKQDCELKAFYRLAPKLKKAFPRFPICLLADGLYAGGPVFSICEKYDWKFLITLKDADIPSVNSEFENLWPLQKVNSSTFIRKEGNAEITQKFRWVCDIPYTDQSENEHLLNVLECIETKDTESTKFKWVANLNVSNKNYLQLASGGRCRWKIENGFNIQKNGGFSLEHMYTKNLESSKVFCYCLQIAHILAQLIEKGNLFKKAFPQGLGSSKNMAIRLREEWLYFPWPAAFWHALPDLSFQIRFDTS